MVARGPHGREPGGPSRFPFGPAPGLGTGRSAPVLRGRGLEIVDDQGRVRASISVMPGRHVGGRRALSGDGAAAADHRARPSVGQVQRHGGGAGAELRRADGHQGHLAHVVRQRQVQLAAAQERGRPRAGRQAVDLGASTAEDRLIYLRWCPACGEEYQPHMTRCLDCGATLQDKREGASLPEEPPPVEESSLPPGDYGVIASGLSARGGGGLDPRLHLRRHPGEGRIRGLRSAVSAPGARNARRPWPSSSVKA